MHLSFFPTLGSSTSLALPPRTDGRLIFQAKFLSREEYDQAQRDGIRIELWANLPSEGSGSEAWGSWLFQKIDPGAPSIIGSTVDSTVLLSDSDEATPLAQEHVLYLQVPVRLQSSTCSTFSFTYRLVYPSGSIHWLGEFGHNGHLSIEPRHSAVSLVDGWGEWENGTCTFKNVSSPLALVGRLNMEYGWSIWAVEQESWPIFCPTIREIPSASCVVLSPLSRLYEVIAPQPLILSASPGTSIHITSTGDILHTSGDASGYVVLRSFNALFDDAFLNDTNHSHTGGSHILSDHRAQSTYAIIASRVPRDAMPVCLTMIPLLASGLPLQAPELP
ncbi:hypothetical protein SCP_0109820 [Sparassis crispa]|uniref:Uncharacterized protein n=1 Tax=Sparassis crispa TaxID=139825 RepID=A0A401G7E7_9APHY|nr:hypothetical protein SCP_0109820 [Sparassis crispa]GBE78100.1 hypothetical protein SCP_0109820 [Sparassis crispa]